MSTSPLTAPRAAGRLLVGAALATAGSCFFTPSAEAHFVLKSPDSWNSQDALGSPQKLGPCGDDGGTPTGKVTAYRAGDTVTITIDETIFHPGHYRVALAKSRDQLPPEPPVTAGSTACGSTVIQDPPVFPVLADGALLHDKAFSAEQTIQVKLPSDLTCDKCTLQVIEFMSEHGLNNPGGCFYHHCADISISPAAGGTGGAGASGGPAAASPSDEGGGCAFATSNAAGAFGLGLCAAALLLSRRRARRR